MLLMFYSFSGLQLVKITRQCNQGQEYFRTNPGMGHQFTDSQAYFTELSVCGQLCHGREWLADYSGKDFCNLVDKFPKKKKNHRNRAANKFGYDPIWQLSPFILRPLLWRGLISHAIIVILFLPQRYHYLLLFR